MARKKSKTPRASDALLASLARYRALGVPFRRVADLVPWAENPRDNAAAVPAVVASLQEFGWTNPVLYRADGGMVEAGHTRLLAAAHLGIEEVPALPLEHDARRATLYALADNRLNEIASWKPEVAGLLDSFGSDEVALAGWDDPAAWLAEQFPGLASDLGAPGPSAEPTATPLTLAERFGVPPFSVLDARGGYWRERKRAWLSLGIRSELGRGEDAPLTWNASAKPIEEMDPISAQILGRGKRALTLDSLSGRVPDYYIQKRAAEARVGRTLSNPEFEAGHLVVPEGSGLSGSGTSVFDPVLTEMLVRWFCPPGGLVLDPFAGGSVRGIVTAACGRRYLGVDLRAEQVHANRDQWAEVEPKLPGLSEPERPADFTPAPIWVVGDSREVVPTLNVEADFALSCPPYADLEVYSDDPADISNMSYADFLSAYREIIRATVERLRSNAFIGWVVGEVRDPKTGAYRGVVPDTIRAFEDAGARYYNEAVLITPGGSIAVRAARPFEGSRKLGKTHQNVLIFVKGDARAATEAIGPVDFGRLEGEDESEGSEEA